MNKIYIKLLIGILMFGIITFVFFGIPELKKRKNLNNSTNIVIDYNTFWSYDKENKWINNSNKIVFGNNKYNVYINKEYKGLYDIELSNDKWYYFDNNNNDMDFEGSLFAYNGSRKISMIDYSINTIAEDDLNYVIKAIDDKSINQINLSDLTVNEKVLLDLDNDGKNEEIYAISNFFCELCDDVKKFYSIAFIVDNNKITILNKSIGDDYYSMNLYQINYIIDLDKDNNYEIVLSKSTAGNNNIYNELFIKTRKGYKKAISSGG